MKQLIQTIEELAHSLNLKSNRMQRPTRPILMLCSVLLLGCSSLPVTSETRDSEISQILLKAEAAWAQVDVTNDKSVFQHIIAPDFVSTGSESGKLKNRQQWLADWEYEGTQSTTQSDMRVHIVAANVAVVTGIQISVGDKQGPASRHEDRFTDTWVKRNGVWQCVAAHVTRLR